MTPGVKQSFEELYIELQRIKVYTELNMPVRWSKVRKLAVALINNQYQDEETLFDILNKIGISGLPKRNPDKNLLGR